MQKDARVVKKHFSRRSFLRLGLSASLGFILSACDGTQMPSLIPVLTNTPSPTPTSTSLPTRTPIIIPTSTMSPCMARASFGDPTVSPYVLPYPVGQSYRVIQGYCDPDGGHVGQLAYDFGMPIGDDVTAARGGIVLELREDTPDISSWDYYNQHNYLIIRHEDGTVAFYAHLKQNSIEVEFGQNVEMGQRIAKSGNSGMTGGKPHLHFGIYWSYLLTEGDDMAVNFRNAGGELDSRGGLMKWKYYEALPY